MKGKALREKREEKEARRSKKKRRSVMYATIVVGVLIVGMSIFFVYSSEQAKMRGQAFGKAIEFVQEDLRKTYHTFDSKVSSFSDYKKKSEEKIKQGIISKSALQNATIEEFAIGTYLNFNYFYTPISDNVDFIGIERRLQTNLHDFNALPAKQQLEMNVSLQNIEVGHTPASIRESLLEKVISMGDKFVTAVKREYPPGIIGPFSLQSVITKDLKMIVYDVSLRVPGNPILATTSPYTKYQYGQTFGIGRRIAMEIKKAYEEDTLSKIVT